MVVRLHRDGPDLGLVPGAQLVSRRGTIIISHSYFQSNTDTLHTDANKRPTCPEY